MTSAKRLLSPYSGQLTSEQIADGMNAARTNAARLLSDAEFLFEKSRFPSAASMAILAIEEAGKCTLLRQLALAKTEDERREAWRAYRSHTKKNIAWILPELVAKGARHLSRLRQIVDEASDHPAVLNAIKQIGFYTDCLAKAHWSLPHAVIDKNQAESLVAIAKVLARPRSAPHTAREVELWIEHLGPVWKKGMAWMQQGVINWNSAMLQEGLAVEGVASFSEFVRK